MACAPRRSPHNSAALVESQTGGGEKMARERSCAAPLAPQQSTGMPPDLRSNSSALQWPPRSRKRAAAATQLNRNYTTEKSNQARENKNNIQREGGTRIERERAEG